MKPLFILRHAKSSWDDPALSDFERPLNQRGQLAAPFMGRLLKEKGFDPAVIFCSPARRARDTVEFVKEAGQLSAEIELVPAVYEASANTLRKIISGIEEINTSAMLVGHNPGMEAIIRFLTGEIEPMPTAAVAVIVLNVDKWDEIDADCGSVVSVFRPRDEMRA